MYFIVMKFIRMISRDYYLKYSIKQNNNHTGFIVCLYGMTKELADKLLDITFEKSSIKPVYDENGNYLKDDYTCAEFRVCKHGLAPYDDTLRSDLKNAVIIYFNEDDYAEKANKLDHELRRWFETHSMIDAINSNN